MAYARQTFTVFIGDFPDGSNLTSAEELTSLAEAIALGTYRARGVLPLAVGIDTEFGGIALTFEDKWDAEWVAAEQRRIEEMWKNEQRNGA